MAIPSALSLSGKHAVVTGAASGIGRATALALADLGADLTLADMADPSATADAVRAQGRNCAVLMGDLTEAAFMKSLFAGARVHALAHCAGILMRTPWDEDADFGTRFHRMMDVNVQIGRAHV
mgnify:FL=1